MAKYNEKELADTSKFLSFVLRHKPEAIGIVLDREGWADIDKLILCAQKSGKRLTRALLDTVVATSDKKRFSYSSDGRCIRAVQGHSTSQVAISFAEKTPPQFLYLHHFSHDRAHWQLARYWFDFHYSPTSLSA